VSKFAWIAAFLAITALAACGGGHGGSLPPIRTLHPKAAAGTYAQIVLGDNPVQYFQLAESAGSTAVDSSPTQINGQYVGTVSYGSAGPLLDEASSAVSLPGSGNTGVSLPKPNVASTSSYTIATWVYPILPASVGPGNAYMTIWGFNATHRLLVNSRTGALLSQFSGNFSSTGKITSGAWHLVAFVYNASTGTQSYYIDGSFDSSASLSSSAAAFTSAYYLGEYDTGVYYKWHGSLAQHAFFNSALSASQISSLYTSAGYGTGPTPTPSSTPTPSAAPSAYPQVVLGDAPGGYFQLNEASGTTAFDSSAAQNNGQYVGAVTYGAPGPLLNQSSTAISLPGTGNTGVSLPKPSLAAGTSYTIATWVFPILPVNPGPGNAYMTIWGYSATHRLLVSSAGQLLSQFNGGFFSAGKLTSNAWHLVVFVYNASTATQSYYIDGQFDRSGALTGSAAAFSSAYYLGQYDTGVYYKWHGSLAQHAFFPSALSGSQISSLYTSAGYAPASPSPTPSPTASPGPTPSFYDWTTFGGNVQRNGYNASETALTTANVGNLHKLWSVNLGAIIDAQPVIAANVTVGSTVRSLLFVGAENGVFDAIDANTGATVWSKQLGNYSYPACTDLPQWGITGTAAINKAASVVYVADGADQVHALDLATGTEKSGWPVTVGTLSQEHIYSALTYNAANGLLYAETAGYCDITPYQGRIVAINASSASIAATFLPASAGSSGGGVWGAGGASIDAATNDVFAATGNVFGSGYGESLLRLNSSLVLGASNQAGAPPGDYDYSGSPMLYKSGACPAQVDAFNKDGYLYTYSIDAINAGPSQSIAITPPKSDTLVAVYAPSTNEVYVTDPQSLAPYTYGLLAFSVQPDCTLSLAWQSSVGISDQNDNSEQVVVANGVAYFTSGVGNAVYALNASTGAQLWSSGTAIGSFAFAAPTVDGGRLYVASWDDNVYAFGL
jgi:hypothetical protein